MGSGRATEAGQTQYKVEKDGRERKRKRKSWVEELECGTHCSG